MDSINHINTSTVRFGPHLIFDAYGCPEDKLNDKDLCVSILNNIVKIAGMRKMMEPHVINAEGNEALGGKDPGGYTGFLIIQESHVSIHTFAKRGFVTIDVYSCKEFEATEIIEYLKQTLQPKDYDVVKLDRGLKYPTENIY
jgi:S-adenosylmethionine decarboxylase